MKKIIALGFLTCSLSLSGCAKFTNPAVPEAKANQEQNIDSSIDPKKAREVSDSITKAIIESHEKDLYAKMEKPFREAVAEKDVKPLLEQMYATYGKRLEIEYKMDESGFEMFNGQKRPIRKFWYAVKTTKEEKGKYFLFTHIVLLSGCHCKFKSR